jgi:hypothetical protein
MLSMNTKKPTGTTCPSRAHAEVRAADEHILGRGQPFGLLLGWPFQSESVPTWCLDHEAPIPPSGWWCSTSKSMPAARHTMAARSMSAPPICQVRTLGGSFRSVVA